MMVTLEEFTLDRSDWRAKQAVPISGALEHT